MPQWNSRGTANSEAYKLSPTPQKTLFNYSMVTIRNLPQPPPKYYNQHKHTTYHESEAFQVLHFTAFFLKKCLTRSSCSTPCRGPTARDRRCFAIASRCVSLISPMETTAMAKLFFSCRRLKMTHSASLGWNRTCLGL